MVKGKSSAYGGFLGLEGQVPRPSTAAGGDEGNRREPFCHDHGGDGHLERGDQRMANNDQRPTHFTRPALLAVTAVGAFTVTLSGCLSQGWGGAGIPGFGYGGAAGMPGYGSGAAGPGQMRMGYSDQHFIVMMIPHHDGAIAMADLAISRAQRPEIKALAKRIKASQTSENAQMRAWYQQWYGKAVPSWAPGTGWGWQNGMGMGRGGGMGMGMRGGTNLSALAAAPDFDRAFIEQMIPHHQMGVMMASMAQTNSQHPQLRAMQQAMVKAQSQEIEQMSQWYRNWYRTP